jgi:hypothetical protein
MSEYIATITLLQSPWNTNLTERDFMIDSETPMRFKRSGTWVILFYGEDEVSKLSLNVWSKVAQVTIGPEFGSCNLRNESKLASKMLDFHPSMKWISNLRVPFILAYSNTWPISKYNGPVDQQSISNWSLTSSGPLSCDSTIPSTPIGTTGPTESTVTIPKTLD